MDNSQRPGSERYVIYDDDFKNGTDCEDTASAQLASVSCCKTIVQLTIDELLAASNSDANQHDENEDEGDRRRLPGSGMDPTDSKTMNGESTWIDPVIVIGQRMANKVGTYDDATDICENGGDGWRLCAVDELTSGEVFIRGQGSRDGRNGGSEFWVYDQCDPIFVSSFGDGLDGNGTVRVGNSEESMAFTASSGESVMGINGILMGAGIGALVMLISVELMRLVKRWTHRRKSTANVQQSETGNVIRYNAVHVEEDTEKVGRLQSTLEEEHQVEAVASPTAGGTVTVFID